MMILYNTIVGLAAGVGMVLVAALFRQLAKREKVAAEGYALGFGMTSFILIVLGITICVMWPYKTVLHANIMLGEPALAFGVLLAAASFFLWRKCELFDDVSESNQISDRAIAQIAALLRPVSVWIFATGLMMASLTAAIWYYHLGKAPPQEPISGYFGQSLIEPAFLTALWGLTGLGALLLPAAVRPWNPSLLIAAALCWRIAGVLFLLFSAMNYFTHIGLLINTSDSF